MFGHWEGFSAQGDNHATVDCRVHDLVLLHIVEELRGVVASRVIFPDIGAFDGFRCRSHLTHHAPDSCVVTKRATLFGMNQRKPRQHGADGSSGSPFVRWLKRSWRQIVHRDEVLLITDKKRTPMQNLRHRKHVYNILQASRIPTLALAGVSYMWWHNVFLAGVLFVVSVPMPWIAVVIANGHGEPRDPREKHVYKPAVARELKRQAELEAQRADEIEPAGPDSMSGKEIDTFRDFDGITIDSDDDQETTDER